MKLQELAAQQPSKQIARLIESYYGQRLDFSRLTERQTLTMLRKVRGLLEQHRSSSARHHSEKSPSYLKLVMMEQALTGQLTPSPATGMQPAAKPGQAMSAGAKPSVATAGTPNPNQVALDNALKKSKAGGTLTPQEQKLVADAVMMKAESRFRKFTKLVFESEVQQAQVVLAAQDMVDKMQGMLEDVSELQFKELPALVDSIKNQVGIDQATQFNNDASAALTGLLQNIQGAKQQLDAALGVVTGQPAPAAMGMGADMAAAGADMAAAGADMGAAVDDMPAPAEPMPAEEPGAPPAGSLGRAKR